MAEAGRYYKQSGADDFTTARSKGSPRLASAESVTLSLVLLAAYLQFAANVKRVWVVAAMVGRVSRPSPAVTLLTWINLISGKTGGDSAFID